MAKSRLLVIAPESMVGSRFCELVGGDFEIEGAGIVEGVKLDITDEGNVAGVLDKFEGEYIVNFAAVTDVAGMEKDRPEGADVESLKGNLGYRVNSLACKFLAREAEKRGKCLVNISTDFVFDGKFGPYSEEDEVAKSEKDVSWYGWTKLLGEKFIQEETGDFVIIRISYPYRREFSGKGDLIRSFLDRYDKYIKGEGNLYPVFTDQWFSPTFVDDVAGAFKVVIDQNFRGMIHVASPEVVDFYSFFCEVLKVARGVAKPESVLTKGSINDYYRDNPKAAKWPKRGGLETEKVQYLGFRPTSWREGIKKLYG